MSIDRLTPDDRIMLWPDEVWPQDIGALAVLDGSNLLDASGGLRIGAVRQAIEARLHLVPRFRQVLHVPRRALGGPLWVDAPAFDLRDHVRVAEVPFPGDEAQMLLAVERLRRGRLDRSRPLWEMWFLTGLPERRVGWFVRLHHVIADGIAGIATVGVFLDAAPDVTAAPAQPWAPAPPPSPRELFADFADNLRRQIEAFGHALSTLERPVTTLRQALAAWPALRELLDEGPVPATSLDRVIGPDRNLALVRSNIDVVKDIAHACKAKVNDVLLAVIAGGLRGLLRTRGEAIEDVIVRIYVPISLRHGQRARATGNLISQMVVPLPIGVSDPGPEAAPDRGRNRHTEGEGSPRSGRTVPWPHDQRGAPEAHNPATGERDQCRHTRPAAAHYLGGAQLLEVFPLLNLIGNVSLGVAALSYAQRLSILVVADRDEYPDIDVITASARDELRALAEATPPTAASRCQP